MVACPLVPEPSRLISGSCSSPRAFVSRFLQTPPRGDALALPLSFASTWLDRGLSPPSVETCPAHTPRLSARRPLALCEGTWPHSRCASSRLLAGDAQACGK